MYSTLYSPSEWLKCIDYHFSRPPNVSLSFTIKFLFLREIFSPLRTHLPFHPSHLTLSKLPTNHLPSQSLQIRLPTLPPPRSHPHPSYPITLSAPLPLPQLSHLHTLLNNALDIIDISRWTGDPQNPSFISGQLRLLADTLDEARQTLKGGAGVVGGNWLDDGDGDSQGEGKEQGVFEPPLPPNLSIHLSIADAALILHIRTLAPSPSSTDLPSLSGLSLRSRLGLGPKLPTHDEVEQVLRWRGEDVCVREKVRVESADPSLMAVMAKLSALGHAVGGWRLKVAVVVGEEVEG